MPLYIRVPFSPREITRRPGRTPRPWNARGGEPRTGHGSDGFLLYHTASLRGSHLEGRSVRIRTRRFAFRGLRVARDARRRCEAPRRRPEPRADDADAPGAPGVAGRYQ